MRTFDYSDTPFAWNVSLIRSVVLVETRQEYKNAGIIGPTQPERVSWWERVHILSCVCVKLRALGLAVYGFSGNFICSFILSYL